MRRRRARRTSRPGCVARPGRVLAAAALAVALVAAAGCGAKPVFRTGDLDRADSAPSRPAPAAPSASRPSPARVEEVASAWLGTPYRYGGVDERGIDCSALVQNVMGDLGARVPRTTRAQLATGRKIPVSGGFRSGDLLFFRLESTRVNHVAIALGPDRFIHASSSRGVVVDRLMDDYFGRRLVEARRVLPDP